MSNTAIAGIGMTPLGKHLDRSVRALTADAVTAALDDARLDIDAIDAAWFCNTRQGALEGQHGVRGQASLRAYGFEGIPIFNTAEKMNYPEKRQAMFDGFLCFADQCVEAL